MTDSPIILPICGIQTDFDTVINDVKDGVVPNEDFWISGYKTGEPSVHGKVNVSLSETNRDLVEYEAKDGVQFKEGPQHHYFAACPGLGIPSTRTLVLEKAYSGPLPLSQGLPRKIAAFDIAPDGSQFATGYDDGSIYLFPTKTTTTPASSIGKPHLTAITAIQFFPSSRVLLTASVDLSLAIVPAELPAVDQNTAQGPARATSARTFKGHSRPVTSTAIVSRGRNIVSGSKDGTVRLWDVSSGNQICMMGSSPFTPVNAIALGERTEGVFSSLPDGEIDNTPHGMDDREVETAEKVVFCALADGNYEVFDLGSKLSAFRAISPRSQALQSISYAPEYNMVATGSSAGVIKVYDIRVLSVPVTTFSRNNAGIEDLSFIPLSDGGVGLAIATEDGLPYIANLHPDGPSVRAELVGVDCDGVRCIRVGPTRGEVWTAGDDGVVRRYVGADA